MDRRSERLDPRIVLRQRVPGRSGLRPTAIAAGLLVAAFALTPDLAQGAGPAPEASVSQTAEKAAPIRLGGKPLYEVRASRAGKPPRERAQAAEKVLREAIEGGTEVEVHIEAAPDSEVIYLGTQPWLRLTEADARAAGEPSVKVHADTVASKLRSELRAESLRRTIATRVFSVSLAVFATLALLFLLRKTSELSEWLRHYLGERRKKVPALSVQNFEVVGPAAMRGAVEVGIEATKWLARAAIVYLWFFVTFSQFSATRDYVGSLTTSFFSPLGGLLARLTTTLPLAFVGLLGLLALALVLRFVSLFFEGVAEGETSLAWLDRDLARPTGVLLRLAIVLGTLLFLAPLLTGNVDGPLPRTALILMLAVGLGAVPLLTSFLIGVSLVYRRSLRVGAEISYGGRLGRLVDLGLLGLLLEARVPRGTRIYVPHLLSLVHPTTVYGSANRSVVVVPVSSHDPKIRELLLGAIAPHAAPLVRLLEVRREGLLFELSASGEDLTEARLYENAHEALLKAGYGIGAPGASA